MYRLVPTNDLEQLIQKEGHTFRSSALMGEQPRLIVQNKNMAHWLQLVLTDQWGITFGLDFQYPDGAMREIVEKTPSFQKVLQNRRILYMDDLKILLYKHMEELFLAQEPQLSVLWSYLPEFQRGSLNENQLYQLADRVAGLFHHYGMNCPDLIDHWSRGVPYPMTNRGLEKDQQWQMYLWNKLFEKDCIHLGCLIQVITREAEYDGPGSPIVIFGSAFLSRQGLQFFQYLSKYISVTQFMLAPAAADQMGSFDHPLLKEWGELAGSFFRVAHENEITIDPCFFPSVSTSMFGGLKNEFTKPSGRVESLKEDGSLQIHGFSGALRQVEGLKDQILSLLEEGYKADDICVLSPRMEDFAPFIEGIFSDQGHGGAIPFNMIDLAFGSESPFLQAFEMLLDFPGSRFTRLDVFQFLRNPCVRKALNVEDSDIQDWIDFTEETCTRWGVDEAQKEAQGAAPDRFDTFEGGFDRFFAGLAIEESSRDFPDMPLGFHGFSQAKNRSVFIKILRRLNDVSTRWMNSQYSLAQWVVLVESLALELIGMREDRPSDSKDRRALRSLMRHLNSLIGELELEKKFDPLVGFPLFRSLLRDAAKGVSGQKGQYLTMGVTFSSLKPLRAIPFKVIFLLGLDDKSFPGQEPPLSFDLRPGVPSSIAMDRRNSDLYSFIETLLSARERLYLFYEAFDPVKGESRNPSILLEQLMNFINERIPMQNYLFLHPMQSYNPVYFNSGSGFFSYQGELKDTLSFLRQTGKKRFVSKDLECLEDLNLEEIHVYDLYQFLKSPIDSYFRKRQVEWYTPSPQEAVSNERRDLSKREKGNWIQERNSLTGGPGPEDGQLLSRMGILPGDSLGGWELSELSRQWEEYNALLTKADVPLPLPQSVRCEFQDKLISPHHLAPLVIPITKERHITLRGRLFPLYPKEEGYFYWGISNRSTPGYHDFLQPNLNFLIIECQKEKAHHGTYVTSDKLYEAQYHWGEPLVVLKALVELYLSHLKNPIPLDYALMGKLWEKWQKHQGEWTMLSPVEWGTVFKEIVEETPVSTELSTFFPEGIPLEDDRVLALAKSQFLWEITKRK